MLAIHVTFHNDCPLVALKGALVLGDGTADLLKVIAWLADSGEVHVMMDLHDVHTTDSSGLATLVQCHQRLRAADGDLVVLRPARRLHRMLCTTGLSTVLRIAETSPSSDRRVTRGKPALCATQTGSGTACTSSSQNSSDDG
jgi:anti-anti-sigma factor